MASTCSDHSFSTSASSIYDVPSSDCQDFSLFLLSKTVGTSFKTNIARIKCNGLNPCNTCSKRSLSCTYGISENEADEPNKPSPKRRTTDPASASNGVDKRGAESPLVQQAHQSPQRVPRAGATNVQKKPGEANTSRLKSAALSMGVFGQQQGSSLNLNTAPPSSNLLSRGSTVSGQDEEAVVYSNNRMLQDPTGRLRK